MENKLNQRSLKYITFRIMLCIPSRQLCNKHRLTKLEMFEELMGHSCCDLTWFWYIVSQTNRTVRRICALIMVFLYWHLWGRGLWRLVFSSGARVWKFVVRLERSGWWSSKNNLIYSFLAKTWKYCQMIFWGAGTRVSLYTMLL